MALTDEEYDKLIILCIKLGLAESMLVEATHELTKANETLRELVLKKE